MSNKTKRIQRIYIIYWLMLAYITAALIFWFVSLWNQNEQMNSLKIKDAVSLNLNSDVILSLQNEKNRKQAQYIGEGITFFLMIMAGAVFIFRSVRRQLKQSQQQQNFMMAITHELKTPIAVAHLNLETLIKRKLDEEQQQKLIKNTLQETSRMDALCNNMLLSSQIEAGGYRMTKEDINLTDLTGNTVAEFVNRYPNKTIIIQTERDVFVYGDALLLQMAINNLVDNAIKYSPKTAAVKVFLTQKGNDVTLSVADEGNGISEKDKKLVFDKFYRAGNEATKSAKGTGLGLYLTLRVVQAHKGKITVANNLPAGSVFSITIPASR